MLEHTHRGLDVLEELGFDVVLDHDDPHLHLDNHMPDDLVDDLVLDHLGVNSLGLDVVLDTFAILDRQLLDILAGSPYRSIHPNCG